MQALKQMAITQAKVLRNGKITWLSAVELVPGDVITLEAGDAVPADIRISESVNLRIEEAALTGESHAIDKITNSLETDDLPVGDRKNMAFKGTFVTYGRGTGVITAGKASGIAATANEILVIIILKTSSPRNHPATKKRIHKNKTSIDNFLPNEAIRCCNGVSTSSSCNIFAMRPNSVCMPVATTIPLPRP